MTTMSSNCVYVLNPALRFIRSTDDEVVVRFGSRGRASRRVKDDAARGVLADLLFCFEGGAKADVGEAKYGEAARELLPDMVEAGLLVPVEDLSFGFLTAGYGSVEPSVGSLAILGEGQFADEAERLLRDALGSKVVVDRRREIEPSSEPADFTVCVADSPDTGFFYDMNEYALTYGANWHSGYLDGPEIIVGPLFVPGETGCYHDFDVMEEAGRSMKLDYLYMKLNGATAKPGQIPGFVASLAAGYLVSSVLQHVMHVGSHLEGNFLRVDLDRLEVIRQRATRLARCPACAEGRPDIRSPFI